jgi:acetate kinase
MQITNPIVLALNCGSSSIKWASYAVPLDQAAPAAQSAIQSAAQSAIQSATLTALGRGNIAGSDQAAIQSALKAALGNYTNDQVVAVGHRVVHGALQYSAPTLINEQVLNDLDALSPLAPLHQPIDILGIRIAQQQFQKAGHVAVLDTAFHRGHGFAQEAYALPRKFFDEGVRRYGFHGISYQYISETLTASYPEIAGGRVVMAHLGSGASMCAMHEGKSQACTMGFSALDGLPMSSRSGQIDPGVLLYLMQHYQMKAEEISDLLYKSSGLKGLSGISGDMRELLASEHPYARQAIDYFVTRCRYEIGGLAALLKGLDALVFTGGMGERADQIRLEICQDLGWLGVELDLNRNRLHQPVISSDQSRVQVLCLATDEERMIAQDAVACVRSS